MITDETILNLIDNVTYLVRDESDNIVKYKNQTAVDIYNYIKKNNLSGKNEYYIKKYRKWYNSICKKIEEQGKIYYIDYFSDITVYKRREVILEHDQLTSLKNRRLTIKLFDNFISEYDVGLDQEFSVLMMDLDYFKKVNDVYGHEAGDVVLKEVADTITNVVDESKNIIGRIGGEEFIILLKNSDLSESLKKADNIRKEINKITIDYNNNCIANITLSIGLYQITKEVYEHYEDMNIDEIRIDMYRKADLAMYISKKEGRNRVSCYSK